jgi:hypothetical protein
MSDAYRIDQLRSANQKGMKDATEKLLASYYCGSEWVEYLKYHIRSIYTKQENRDGIYAHLSPIPITERICSELACVYEVNPQRVVFGENGEALSDDLQEAYQELIERMSWNVSMQEVERRTVLLNNVAVVPVPDVYGETLEVEIVPVTDLKVIQDEIFPQKFDRCKRIEMQVDSGGDSIGGIYRSSTMVFEWDYKSPETPVSVRLYDSTNRDLGDVGYNGIKGYPIFLARPNTPPRGELFLDVPWDMLGIAYYMGWRDAARAYVTAMHEMEPPVFQSSRDMFDRDNGKDALFSPFTAVFSPEGPVAPLEWNPKAEEYKAQMLDRLQRFVQANHLPKSFADMIVAESGVSKYWDEAPKRAWRQRHVPYWADFERRCHAILMALAESAGMDVPPQLLNSSLSVTFPPLPSTMSPLEHVQYVTAQVQANLMSRAEAIASLRGIDLAEAEDIAQEIASGNGSTSPDLSPMSRLMLGRGPAPRAAAPVADDEDQELDDE